MGEFSPGGRAITLFKANTLINIENEFTRLSNGKPKQDAFQLAYANPKGQFAFRRLYFMLENAASLQNFFDASKPKGKNIDDLITAIAAKKANDLQIVYNNLKKDPKVLGTWLKARPADNPVYAIDFKKLYANVNAKSSSSSQTSDKEDLLNALFHAFYQIKPDSVARMVTGYLSYGLTEEDLRKEIFRDAASKVMGSLLWIFIRETPKQKGNKALFNQLAESLRVTAFMVGTIGIKTNKDAEDAWKDYLNATHNGTSTLKEAADKIDPSELVGIDVKDKDVLNYGSK